jgi:hypothetical protein
LRDQGIDVPTRGALPDEGTGAASKLQVVKMWLEGSPLTEIERETWYSGTSIHRYLTGFSRVVRFHSKGYSGPEICELAGISERLVKEYIELDENCMDRPEVQARLEKRLAGPLQP